MELNELDNPLASGPKQPTLQNINLRLSKVSKKDERQCQNHATLLKETLPRGEALNRLIAVPQVPQHRLQPQPAQPNFGKCRI